MGVIVRPLIQPIVSPLMSSPFGDTASAPTAPATLVASQDESDETTINLTWTDASDDETGFEIERSLDGVAWAPLTTPAADATGYADEGLDLDTVYYYRIRAVNDDGESEWSNTASAAVYHAGARDFFAADKAAATRASFTAANLSTTDFSLVSTVYRRSTGNQVIAAKYQDASNYWRWEVTAGHKLHFIAVIGGVTLIEVTGATSLSSTSSWYHAALVVDRDATATTKIYLNGVNDTSGTPTVSVSTIDNTGAFWLAQSGADTLFWNGRLHGVGIQKNDLLSSTEVTWLSHSAAGRYYVELGVTGTDGVGLANFSWWANGNEAGDTDGVVDDVGTNDLTLSFAELLSNTGFETLGGGGADVFANWLEVKGGTGTVSDEAIIVDSGSHAAKLTGSGGVDYAAVYQDVLTLGHRYTFSVRARHAVSGNGQVYIGSGSLTTLTLTSSYATYSATGTCAADISFTLQVYTGGLIAYFDNASVKAVDVPAVDGPV